MPRIPLFDIDWTLMQGGNKAHSDAFDYVFAAVYEAPHARLQSINHSGMTDMQAIFEVLMRYDFTPNQIEEKIDEAIKQLVSYFLKHEAEGTYDLMPGARSLVSSIAQKRIPVGILTGNARIIGWHKLAKTGINHNISFGAFGDCTRQRHELVTVANHEVTRKHQLANPQFVIIGDTPRDVECARKAGVPVIAVATGKASIQKLRETNPDVLVESLEDQKPILEFLQI